MLADWENLRLHVKMIDGSGGVGTGDEAKRLVLNKLKTFNRRRRIVGEQDGSREVEEGADETLECRCQTFFVATEVRVRNRAQNI